MPEKEIKKKRTAFRKIVNVFLSVFIGIFILILILIGFTQTAAFRNILRDKALSIVNESLNGKINFEKINGTLFTSLTLQNTSIVLENDTILFADKISVVYNPLQLLFSKIQVRDFNLENARLVLVKDSLGVFNISKLSKPKEDKDTTRSPFPFAFDVKKLNIKNTHIRLVDYTKLDSDSLYTTYNLDDFNIDSLYLSLGAYIDIAGNHFYAKIDEFRFKPNLTGFRLHDLSGEFTLTDSYARVKDFHLKSNVTDLDLFASFDNVNLFNNFKLADLKKSPVELKLKSRVFDFSDLSTFVTSTDFMKGTLKADIAISGEYGNLDIKKLDIDYLKTHLSLSGNIKNLHKPEEMYIKAGINNSYIHEPDIAELMPLMELPVYENLELKNLAAEFNGELLKFETALSADLNEGSFKSKGKFDFSGEQMVYDINLETSKLNLQPVLSEVTDLNINAAISGTGTDPKLMNTKADIRLKNSRYGEYILDTLQLNSVVNNGVTVINLDAVSKGAAMDFAGRLNLNNEDSPEYVLNGSIKRLNLDRFLADTSLATDLNLNIDLSGKNFDLNEIESKLNVILYNSSYQEIRIDTTVVSVNIQNLPNDERLIDINSEFARMQIAGKFAPGDAVSLISYESDIFTRSIMKKIYEFNPWAFAKDTAEIREFEKKIIVDTKVPEIVKSDLDMNYNITIKDFDLIASLAGLQTIDIDGRIYGGLNNSNNIFSASTNVELNHLRLNTGENPVYISGLDLQLKVNRENEPVAFENISTLFQLNADRIFSGTDVKNIFALLDLDKNTFSFDLSADVDTTMNASLSGRVNMAQQQFDITVHDFLFNFLGYEWTNDSTWRALYTKDNLVIDRLSMKRNGSHVYLTGSLFSDGKEELNLKIENLDTELINKLSGMENNLSADIDASVKLNGYLHDPVMDVDLDVNNIVVNKMNLGFLNVDMDYEKKLLKSEVIFLDSTLNRKDPELTLFGNVPIDLGFVGVKDRYIKGKDINISLTSEGFELSVLGSLVPFVRSLSGKLLADLKIGGTTDNLTYSGSLRLNDVNFTAEQNNLPYNLGLKISLEKDAVLIDSLSLANAGGTLQEGKITGNGRIDLNEMELEKIGVELAADNFVVLSELNSPSIPVVAGNLVLDSDGAWKYTYSNNGSYFNGKVLLENTDLTITPEVTAYEGDASYNYVFISDSVTIEELMNDSTKAAQSAGRSNLLGKTRTQKSGSNGEFEYNVNVGIKDRAAITFILDRTTNSRLVANLNGNVLYRSDGVAQGKFELLDGSSLYFIKEFTADGEIFFESDPTNPRLNVTATYEGRYRDSIDVAVKIKLEGQVTELGKNLTADQKNIAVYIGDENIDQNVPSPEYGPQDALSFIVVGKFVKDLTEGDRRRAASNIQSQSGGAFYAGYAESALSGVLSGFVNSQLGNYVESIRLENLAGSDANQGTKVSVMGSTEDIKYSFGLGLGSTTNATFSIEYRLIENLLIKLERRDPIIQTTNPNTKINEIGLRYKFIF